MKSPNRTITMLTLLALALTPALAGAQEVLHGRVSYADEGALVKGTDDEDWSYATTNALVMPGDVLWADEQSTMEIEFSGGVFFRLADGSKMDVISVPPKTVLRGESGSFYIQRISRSTGSVVFNTPIGGVQIAPDSQVRFDVLSEGPTTITVRWGRATIVTDDGNTQVLVQGQRSYIDPGYAPSEPVPFNKAEEDDFDTWNRERARLLALGSENVPIQSTVEEPAPIGVSDLNGQGEWVYVDNNYYWRPTVVVNYVPYRSGYWSYVPSQGQVWIGDYSFSYVTSHYGRWRHHHRHGWIWRYHYGYSPAWVSTVRYGDYYVWSPVDYYGYPVSYGHATYYAGGLSFSLMASSYVHHDYLHHSYRRVHRFESHHMRHANRHNISAWDIHARRSRYRDSARHRSTLPRRDISPHRVMRGPGRIGGRTLQAADRAGRLQSRTRTARNERTAIRTARKPGSPGNRINHRAETRRVRLNRPTHTTTTRDIQRARDNSDATRRLVSRNRNVKPTSASRRPDPGTRVRQVGTSPTSARRPTPSTSGTQRIRRVPPTNTQRATRPSSRTTRTAPTTSSARKPSAVSRTTRSTRPTVTSTPPSSTRRVRTRTEPGTQSTRVAPPVQSQRRVTRVAPPVQSQRRVTRTAPPVQSQRRVTRTAPQVRSQPRVTRTAPAPNRSRNTYTPPTQSAPRVSRPAPQQRQAPQSVNRSIQSRPAPQSRPSRSVSNSPSRSSAGTRSVAPSRGSSGRNSSGRSSRGRR